MPLTLMAAAQEIQVEVVDPGGFDWTAAGLGALAAVGLVLVLIGVVWATRTTDRREPS